MKIHGNSKTSRSGSFHVSAQPGVDSAGEVLSGGELGVPNNLNNEARLE
jgi:hypothetical protein